MSISRFKNYLKENPDCKWNHCISALFRLMGGVHIKGKRSNTIKLTNTYAKHLSIKIIGKNNVIDFREGANYFQNSSIYIHGNNNCIIFGKRNYIEQASLYIEDDNNLIKFGDHNRIFGRTHIATIEGTSVIFGDECLFSDSVVFRTGDSHSIFDSKSGVRINPSKSIEIGNRIWFGNTTTILKGVTIGDNAIIGTGAIVTKDVPNNVIVAGNPSKVIKENVKWGLHRILNS